MPVLYSITVYQMELHGQLCTWPYGNKAFIMEPQLRFLSRNWYVNTASPKRKNIVIVVDESASMSRPPFSYSRMEAAKDAARTIINTLSAKDWVSYETEYTGSTVLFVQTTVSETFNEIRTLWLLTVQSLSGGT